MIKPTIGRIVWYWAGKKEEGAQPFAATIAHVWSDTCINIGYFDGNGQAGSATSVLLVQEGEPIPAGQFCEWMPYQKGQAAKAEVLESQLASFITPPSTETGA